MQGCVFVTSHWGPSLVQEIYYQEADTVDSMQWEDTAARHFTSQSGTMHNRQPSEIMS